MAMQSSETSEYRQREGERMGWLFLLKHVPPRDGLAIHGKTASGGVIGTSGMTHPTDSSRGERLAKALRLH
jgi:hypothetical protein